jgi:hypothetical protein
MFDGNASVEWPNGKVRMNKVRREFSGMRHQSRVVAVNAIV